MADRVVKVILRGDVGDLTGPLKVAAKAVEDTAKQMTAAEKSGDRFRKGLSTVGDTAGKMGVTAAAGLGLVGKAAVDWESDWAGVTKTVDGSASQMGQLETGLRGVAKTLPATHTEIAGVAEAAGQLGVQRPAIVGFTRTMINLGETTNLSSDRAATSIAQMMNVMRSAPDEVDRIASTLVALGNAGASTEADIMSMAQRLSGAGQLIGASEADVLALASSMADLGIEAELGGGAMSRTLTKIFNAVETGGAKVQGFADVAGMSAQQFAQAWQQDPTRAVDAFFQGLNRIDASGGNVIATLKDLGIKGTQDLSVLLRMKGAQDGLTNALDLSARAWQDNNALTDEAAKRYATTGSQARIALNKIKDAGIEAGDVLLPMVAKGADLVGGMADAFGALPGPMQDTVTGLTAVTAVTGGALWFGAKVVGGITDTRQALKDLGVDAPKTARGLRAVGGAVAFAGAVIALDDAIDGLTASMAGALPSSEELAGRLIDLSSGEMTSVGDEFRDIGEALDFMNSKATTGADWFEWVPNITGLLPGENAIEKIDNITREFESLDAALTNIATSGSAEQAEEAFAALAEAEGLTAGQQAALLEQLPQYRDALLGQANAAALAADEARSGVPASKASAGGLKDVKTAADEAADALERYVNKQHAAADAAVQGKRDELALKQAVIDARRAVEKSTESLDESSKAGRENWSQLLDVADAWNTSEDKVQEARGAYRQMRGEFVDLAVDMGASREEARKYADKFLDIPPNVAKAKGAVDRFAVGAKDALKGIRDEEVEISLSASASAVWNSISNNRRGNWSGSGPGLATGGPVIGPGTGTSDSIPARLSHGEHVWTAEEVRKAGGHEAILAMRKAILTGGIDGPVTGYATGGPVLDSRVVASGMGAAISYYENVFDRISDTLSARLSKAVSKKLENMNPGGGVYNGPPGAWQLPLNRGAYSIGGSVGSYPGHTGLDLPASYGTPIFAAANGVVSQALDLATSYGRHVYINHSGGAQTRYAHMARRAASQGDVVRAGRVIGYVDSSGNSTGNHLHYETRVNGAVLEPKAFMSARGASFGAGGYLTGPGTATSDSIPAWLSNGEYVVKAAAVDKYGVDLFDHLNAMRFADGGHYQATRPTRQQVERTTVIVDRGLSDRDVHRIAAAVQAGTYQGAREGAQQGSEKGAYNGSREGIAKRDHAANQALLTRMRT